MHYGMRICQEFGEYMAVGYVPDSFGQASSMPQIYQEFEIEDTLFWRGVSDDDVQKTEFKWRGEDGSIVNVYQIPSGYYIGGAIPEKEAELAVFLKNEPFKTTWGRSSTNQVYFPNGFDQAPPRENLPELIEKMNTLYKDEFELHISTIEKYIEAVKNEQPELEELAGELINGKLMRIHKTIFSSRSDLKHLNTQVQNYLVNVMEPLLTLSMRLGFEYPVETVREIWKLMFENAAHDSIGSCVSDTTNEDIYMRYKQARDIATNLVELTMREIATRVNHSETKEITLTLFNTLDKKRSGVIEAEVYIPQTDFRLLNESGDEISYSIIELVDQTEYVLNQGNILDPSKEYFKPTSVYKAKLAIDATAIPSVGYTQIMVDLAGNSHNKIEQNQHSTIENDFYTITINENGSLDIFEKQSNTLYKNQAIIEENGDNGDSFNYSPPENDLVIHSTEFHPKVTVNESDLIKSISLHFDMLVPKNLTERAQKKQTTSLPVTLSLMLAKNSPILEFSLKVDNQSVDSHRVCVLFDTGISSKFSTADHQFGVIQRPVVFEKEMSLWEQNQSDWNEKPIAIETCQTFVSLFDDQKGVSVMPKGVREYEIIGEKFDTIRLTIFRTYGFMGKENLMYRPGRASGETVIETPDAQCHKTMTFVFSALYYAESFDQANVAELAKQTVTPVQVYQTAEFLNSRLIFTLADVAKTLPPSYCLLATEGELILSVIKKAEERPGVILRFYNGNLQLNQSETVQFNQPVSLVEKVNLKEETVEKMAVSDNSVVIENLSHAKFVTLYVEF